MILYLVFCLATAICSTSYLVIPVLDELKVKHPNNETLRARYLIIFLSMIFYFIAAPLFFFIYLDSQMSESFKRGLAKGLTKKI